MLAQYAKEFYLHVFGGPSASPEPRPGKSPETFLVDNDSVQVKCYSRFIDLAKRQYSADAHSMVTGIGPVNLVHSSGEPGDFLLLDYHIYAPDRNEQTKNDHFLAIPLQKTVRLSWPKHL